MRIFKCRSTESYNMNGPLYIFNGIILTQANPPIYSRSLTVMDGLVHAIDGEPPSGAFMLDLKGQVMIPGFVDSHLHLIEGSSGMGDVDLRGITSKEAFRAVLLDAASKVKDGHWLVAFGWTQEALGASPDLSWFPEEIQIPILCYRVDFHSAVMNKFALDGIPQEEVKDIAGGDEIAQGRVKEDALYSIVCPLIPEQSVLVKQNRTIRTMRRMQKHGLTLLGTMEHLSEVRDVLLPLDLRSFMRIRVMCLDEPNNENARLCASFENNSFLKCVGFKGFLDGSLGSRTAKMYAPWDDVLGAGVWAGIAADGSVNSWVKRVAKLGFFPVMHAIGDEAVGVALEAVRDIDAEIQPRIEHAQFIADKDIPFLSGRMFGVQPLHQVEDQKIAIEAVGEKRAGQLHNWRRMLDAGALLSFGSDWPVAEANPIAAMRVAIANGVCPEEALESSTSTACASLDPALTGKLTVGSFADMVLLDCDPLRCDWEKKQPTVVMTMLEGKIVYEKE